MTQVNTVNKAERYVLLAVLEEYRRTHGRPES